MENPKIDIQSALDKMLKRIQILEKEFYKPDRAETCEPSQEKIDKINTIINLMNKKAITVGSSPYIENYITLRDASIIITDNI